MPPVHWCTLVHNNALACLTAVHNTGAHKCTKLSAVHRVHNTGVHWPLASCLPAVHNAKTAHTLDLMHCL